MGLLYAGAPKSPRKAYFPPEKAQHTYSALYHLCTVQMKFVEPFVLYSALYLSVNDGNSQAQGGKQAISLGRRF